MNKLPDTFNLPTDIFSALACLKLVTRKEIVFFTELAMYTLRQYFVKLIVRAQSHQHYVVKRTSMFGTLSEGRHGQ